MKPESTISVWVIYRLKTCLVVEYQRSGKIKMSFCCVNELQKSILIHFDILKVNLVSIKIKFVRIARSLYSIRTDECRVRHIN